MIPSDPRFAEAADCFDHQHFFEAHEVWEALWRDLPRSAELDAPGSDRRFVQGLIQLAVSFEHWKRGNPRGARGQWEKAAEKLSVCGAERNGVKLVLLLERAPQFYGARDLPAAERAQAAGTWETPKGEPYPTLPYSDASIPR